MRQGTGLSCRALTLTTVVLVAAALCAAHPTPYVAADGRDSLPNQGEPDLRVSEDDTHWHVPWHGRALYSSFPSPEHVTSLTIEGGRGVPVVVNSSLLDLLSRCTSLESLTLRDVQGHQVGLVKTITALPALRELALVRARLGASEWRELDITRLESLDLRDSLSANRLVPQLKMAPLLRTLRINGRFDDASLIGAVAELQLTALHIRALTEPNEHTALAQLKLHNSAKLRSLSLERFSVDNRAMGKLLQLPHLSELQLLHCVGVGEVAISLTQVSHLKSLSLDTTDFQLKQGDARALQMRSLKVNTSMLEAFGDAVTYAIEELYIVGPPSGFLHGRALETIRRMSNGSRLGISIFGGNGADFRYDTLLEVLQLTGLQYLSMFGICVWATDSDESGIGMLPHAVEHLSLLHCSLCCKSASVLLRGRGLRSLDLVGTGVCSTMLADAMEQCEVTALECSRVRWSSAADIARIFGQSGFLEVLRLNLPEASDQFAEEDLVEVLTHALKALKAGAPFLHTLWLRHLMLSEDGATAVSEMTQLRFLMADEVLLAKGASELLLGSNSIRAIVLSIGSGAPHVPALGNVDLGREVVDVTLPRQSVSVADLTSLQARNPQILIRSR